MTILRHTRTVLRLVPIVLRLWWADVREPGAALRVLRVVAAWCLAWAAILWGGATLGGAIVAALAGSYSLIALTVRDRLEAL